MRVDGTLIALIAHLPQADQYEPVRLNRNSIEVDQQKFRLHTSVGAHVISRRTKKKQRCGRNHNAAHGFFHPPIPGYPRVIP